MLRLRTTVPLLLLSSLATPAVGEFNASHCAAGPGSPRCEAERAREFAAARNAEIEASIAAVAANRARLAAAKTHCKSLASNSVRCLAEQARMRALALTHCKTPDSTTPRCLAERTREFAKARNAEVDASIARVKAEGARAFAAARNAEIERSIAAVNAERARMAALALTHCKTADSTTPRCLAERAREFAAARNLEIETSIAAVEAERASEFAAARNVEIERSIAVVAAERARAFAAVRNAEINASIAAVEFVRERNAEIERSIAAVKAELARKFAMARNAEIERSIAAYKAQRALRLALARRKSRGSDLTGLQERLAVLDEQWETGAIGEPSILSADPRPQQSSQRTARYAEPCRAAVRNLDPLRFANGSIKLDDDMKSTLNQLAMIAKACPTVRMEIHGYTDASGPAQVKRLLSHRRAQEARNYLLSRGIDRDRLAAIGHGDADPLVPNTTAENRASNRRIEIKMMDPAMHAAARRIMWDLAELLDPTYVPPLAQLSP